MNKTQKGNYYKRKTKEWFEKDGYEVKSIEIKYKIMIKEKDKITGEEKDKIIFVKKDLWGGDLVATNGKELIWIQVKTNKNDINKGLKKLEKSPLPDFVDKIVVWWPERAREPEIVKLEK